MKMHFQKCKMKGKTFWAAQQSDVSSRSSSAPCLPSYPSCSVGGGVHFCIALQSVLEVEKKTCRYSLALANHYEIWDFYSEKQNLDCWYNNNLLLAYLLTTYTQPWEHILSGGWLNVAGRQGRTGSKNRPWIFIQTSPPEPAPV